MVLVVRVVIGAEHRLESLAGALVNCPQEFAFRLASATPVPLDADPATVLQYKGRDIDRFGSGMGRLPTGSGDGPARIAAHGFDFSERAAEVMPRSPIDSVSNPAGHRVRHMTGEWAKIGYLDPLAITGKAIETNCPELMASGSEIAIRQRIEACARRTQRGEAQLYAASGDARWRLLLRQARLCLCRALRLAGIGHHATCRQAEDKPYGDGSAKHAISAQHQGAAHCSHSSILIPSGSSSQANFP